MLDALLVAGCAVKFFDGGWFPVASGARLFLAMSLWSHGRLRFMAAERRDGIVSQPLLVWSSSG